MPPFLFMKKVTFVLDTISLPSMAEYTTFPVSQPTILKLNDGSGAIKLDGYTGYWINQTQMNMLLASCEPESDPQPPQKLEGSVTELTLLRALAIAQQPELALNLLKD